MAVKLRNNILGLSFALALGASAQVVDSVYTTRCTAALPDKNILNHMDLSLTAGTLGAGLDIAMPVTDYVKVRAGINFTPRIDIPMTFDLMAYSGTDEELDQDTKFDKLAGLMEQFTGFKIDHEIKTKAHATLVDARLLVDVYPWKANKHWHVTAGFYWGASRVGHIENTIQEAPSLMGVMMYNRMYDFFHEEKYLYEPLYDSFWMDPDVGDQMRDKFDRYGKVGAYLGKFKNGQDYIMQPDNNGMVRADMYVNHFKPYLGIGYDATVSKDKKWHIGFDAGALFWGAPKVYTHEHYTLGKNRPYTDDGKPAYGTPPGDYNGTSHSQQINMSTDVTHVPGKVGKYVRLASAMHVWPVINFKISYTIF